MKLETVAKLFWKSMEDNFFLDCRFGQYNFCSATNSRIFESKNTLVITDFYQNYPLSRNGSSVELSNSVYLELKQKSPEVFVYRVKGKEMKLFSHHEDSHYFLLLSNHDVMKQRTEIHERPHINSFLEQERYVLVDPTLQVLEFYKNSNYIVENVLNQGARKLFSRDLYLKDKDMVNLGLTSNNDLVYLIYDSNSRSKMNIGIRRKGNGFYSFDLNSPSFETIFKHEPLLSNIIYKMQNLKISRKRVLPEKKYHYSIE